MEQQLHQHSQESPAISTNAQIPPSDNISTATDTLSITGGTVTYDADAL